MKNCIFILFLFLSGCFSGQHQFLWENDFVAPNGKDKNYTNGNAWIYSPDEETTVTVAQQFYTPDDLRDPDLIPDDRPYAGQLSVGYNKHNVERFADDSGSKESVGVKVGCTGGCSGAETIQKFVHDDLDSGTYPEGWHNQIATEPTVAVNYEYLYRPIFISTGDDFALDTIMKARGDLGTDITRATTGPMVRFGYRLPNDFGPDVIETTGIESESEGIFRSYLYARAEGTATLYNIFIDNHLFNSGTQLDLENWGADMATGLMLHVCGYKVGFQFIWRTKEYAGDSTHKFGSVTLGWDI